MISANDIIQINLTKQEIIECLQKAVNHKFIDNLRNRHPNVQFDCKLRGYVGEYAIRKWFNTNGITIEATDYLKDGDNIDIDFLVKGRIIELKTSLMPDNDKSFADVINNRDIKLIKRGQQSINELKGDIHMQIYFNQKTKAKDNWLKMQDINLTNDTEYLYTKFRADAYLNTTMLVAWIDKGTLINYIDTLPEGKQHWTFAGSQREFWKCPLSKCRQPIEIIQYLKQL